MTSVTLVPYSHGWWYFYVYIKCTNDQRGAGGEGQRFALSILLIYFPPRDGAALVQPLTARLNYRFTKHGGNLGLEINLCLIWIHKGTNLTKTPFLACLIF